MNAREEKKKRKYPIIAVLFGVVGAAGFLLWFMNDSDRRLAVGASPSQQVEPIKNDRSKGLAVSFSSQKTQQPENTGVTGKSEHLGFGLAEKQEKATRLRDALLKKQEEIQALKLYYRNRIQEVRDEILNEKRETGITTFQRALKNKRIELGLRTIRRRHAYINKLNGPLEKLHGGSEKLRYIKRLAGIQIEMARVVNGIDIGELGKRMDIVIEKESHDADSLSFDMRGSSAPVLEEIWKEIIQEKNVKKISKTDTSNEEKPKKKKAYSERQDKINMEIWREICAGNPSRKCDLTKLSIKAAKCLARWEGKDLFLTGITELPAPIAEQLSQWEGEWLCLNHLTELSPEAAEGLSRWRGIRLSLNGLTELTPQAAKHLSRWRGKQMEVVGLAKISPEANKYLATWQKAGGEIIFR